MGSEVLQGTRRCSARAYGLRSLKTAIGARAARSTLTVGVIAKRREDPRDGPTASFGGGAEARTSDTQLMIPRVATGYRP